MNRCVIISGGELGNPAFYKTVLRCDDFLICADRGLQYALQLGLTPDLAVGDFDSFPLPQNPSYEIIQLPSVKDDTDTVYAIREAISRGFTDILLLAVTGGRTDHFIANIQSMLLAAKQGCSISMEDEFQRIFLLPANSSRIISADYGKTFSLLALSQTVKGVCVDGAKYCLENAKLAFDYPLGISNEIVTQNAKISVKSGYLLLICNRNI